MIDRIELAKIVFIADSTVANFRATAPGEQEQIDLIKAAYRPYLYCHEPPQEVYDILLPVAQNLIDNTPNFGDLHLLYFQP